MKKVLIALTMVGSLLLRPWRKLMTSNIPGTVTMDGMVIIDLWPKLINSETTASFFSHGKRGYGPLDAST